MYEDTIWYGGRPQPRQHCVRWGPSCLSPKGAQPPNFWPMSVVAKRLDGWTKVPLGMEIGLCRDDFVFSVDPAPPEKRAQPPIQFSAHVCCGQTAGWIKIPLGTEVDLGPGDVVLDGGQSSPLKWALPPPPIFGSCLLWPNGWMDKDATWYGSRPWPMLHCVRWDPAPHKKRGQPPGPPSYRPMSIVATVAYLTFC